VLVSIVTPSYNQGRFLRRTVESVLRQTYPHVEYVVIDGGSRDGSRDVLRSYGDRFFWVSERDRGQADAINKGFARCRGEIRAFLNSDDVLEPDAVARAVAHFRAHPDWDMLYGEADYIDEDDRVTGRYETDDYSFDRLMRNCCVCQPAAFWTRRIAERVGPFNVQLHCALDYEYWLRIARAGGRIVRVPDLLASSRRYPETKTLSLRERVHRESIRVCFDQGGYADEGHFHALWRHLCWEKPDGWPRHLRRLPRFSERMAYWHFRACHWCARRSIKGPSALASEGSFPRSL
jgi:glycosyltransferase involved in cell wall biosynthesis